MPHCNTVKHLKDKMHCLIKTLKHFQIQPSDDLPSQGFICLAEPKLQWLLLQHSKMQQTCKGKPGFKPWPHTTAMIQTMHNILNWCLGHREERNSKNLYLDSKILCSELAMLTKRPKQFFKTHFQEKVKIMIQKAPISFQSEERSQNQKESQFHPSSP